MKTIDTNKIIKYIKQKEKYALAVMQGKDTSKIEKKFKFVTPLPTNKKG